MIIRPLAFIACLSLPVFAQDAPETPAAPEMDAAAVKENTSYAFGYQSGIQFGRQVSGGGLLSSDISADVFTKGFLDGFGGEELAMDEEKVSAAMEILRTEIEAREAKVAEASLAEGQAFLEANKSKDGVITTESGLQYTVLEKGGEESFATLDAETQENPEFLIAYTGTLIDGTEFDASPEGEPIAIGLEVIPGFAEALKLMPKGAKWKVFIPAELAYGAERAGNLIKPNSVLIFDLELTDITKAAPQQPFQFPGGAPGQEAPATPAAE